MDTGVLYAGADEDDRHHQASSELLDTHPGPLLVPVPVVTETAWLIEDRLGPLAEARFLRSVADGELTRVDLQDEDWTRVIQLIETYSDLTLGLVDASVIAAAERPKSRMLPPLTNATFAWSVPATLKLYAPAMKWRQRAQRSAGDVPL